MVTPFMFRAVTSSPRGKWRSIFFTGGVVSIFFKTSLSSIVEGEVLSFLQTPSVTLVKDHIECWLVFELSMTEAVQCSVEDDGEKERQNGVPGDVIPVELLCLLCYLQFNTVPLCDSQPRYKNQHHHPFSAARIAWREARPALMAQSVDTPRSLMFITPGALELVRFFAGICLSSFGDDESPLTAESTFELSCASAAIVV